MKVAKWGNSLAIRLPAAVVEALDLKIGDEINMVVGDTRSLEVSRDHSREEALAGLKALRRPLPPDFRFDRKDANER
jgi:antitoxin MazE